MTNTQFRAVKLWCCKLEGIWGPKNPCQPLHSQLSASRFMWFVCVYTTKLFLRPSKMPTVGIPFRERSARQISLVILEVSQLFQFSQLNITSARTELSGLKHDTEVPSLNSHKRSCLVFLPAEIDDWKDEENSHIMDCAYGEESLRGDRV